MAKSVRIMLPKAFAAGLTTFVFFLTACGGGGGGGAPPPSPPAPTPSPTPTATPTPAPSSTEREVAPNTANPALSAGDAANFTINPDPAVTARGRLFVMLPGTGAIPRNYRTVVRTGAARGYHGIGLTYPNAQTVGELCAVSSDPDCIGKTRREIITGENTSTVVEIDPANSVSGRLYALLGYMDRTYPLEGWGRFIAGGTVDWSLVTLAGHSQGAGHADYAAKLFSLDRVAMFSGPGDVPVGGGAPNPWLTLPNVTPASRQFGFTHSEDELVPFALLRANWTAMGLPTASGAPESVDGASAPYRDSRQLVTIAAPSAIAASLTPWPKHSAPVADGVTPTVTGGGFLYTPVWVYMAFP